MNCRNDDTIRRFHDQACRTVISQTRVSLQKLEKRLISSFLHIKVKVCRCPHSCSRSDLRSAFRCNHFVYLSLTPGRLYVCSNNLFTNRSILSFSSGNLHTLSVERSTKFLHNVHGCALKLVKFLKVSLQNSGQYSDFRKSKNCLSCDYKGMPFL